MKEFLDVSPACVFNYRVRRFISYSRHILPNNRSTSLLFTAPVEERAPTTQNREQLIHNKGAITEPFKHKYGHFLSDSGSSYTFPPNVYFYF